MRKITIAILFLISFTAFNGDLAHAEDIPQQKFYVEEINEGDVLEYEYKANYQTDTNLNIADDDYSVKGTKDNNVYKATQEFEKDYDSSILTIQSEKSDPNFKIQSVTLNAEPVDIYNADFLPHNHPVGLLSGKSALARELDRNKKEEQGVTAFTDRNPNTSYSLQRASAYWQNAIFEFDEPMMIEASYQMFKTTSSGSASMMELLLYDKDKKLVGRPTINNNEITQFTPVHDVVSAVIRTRSYGTNEYTHFDVYGKTMKSLYEYGEEITDFDYSSYRDSIRITWKNPDSDLFTRSNVYVDDVPMYRGKNESYVISNLKPDTSYRIKVTTTSNEEIETEGLTFDLKTIPLPFNDLEVSDLTQSVVDRTKLQLEWVNPQDEKYKETRVYLDDELVYQGINESFNIENLKYDRSYRLRVTTVTNENVESTGVLETFRTEKEPPRELEPPTGINASASDESLFITWQAVKHSYLVGYNVYVDGVLMNNEPLKGTSFKIDGLENKKRYSIQVSAVAESEEFEYKQEKVSDQISGVPRGSLIPKTNIGFDLSDLVLGVTGWFNSLWLIIAFSVAIPLAFYVSIKVKELFLTS